MAVGSHAYNDQRILQTRCNTNDMAKRSNAALSCVTAACVVYLCALGDVAQLGEHGPRMAGVRGSSPLISTHMPISGKHLLDGVSAICLFPQNSSFEERNTLSLRRSMVNEAVHGMRVYQTRK
jgi:hypothetical protein